MVITKHLKDRLYVCLDKLSRNVIGTSCQDIYIYKGGKSCVSSVQKMPFVVKVKTSLDRAGPYPGSSFGRKIRKEIK